MDTYEIEHALDKILGIKPLESFEKKEDFLKELHPELINCINPKNLIFIIFKLYEKQILDKNDLVDLICNDIELKELIGNE